MVRITTVLCLLVVIAVSVGCGSSEADTTAGASYAAQGTPRGFFGGGDQPLSMMLPVGTLMLEETALAVTPEQAQELLPLWQMLRALQDSGTSSQVEIEALYDQIQEAMTPEQLAAIEEMSPEDMRSLFEELGMGRPQGESGGDDEEEGWRGGPPDMGGMMPPGGGEGRQGMGPGGFADLSPEERATMVAGRGGAGMGFGGTAFTEQVIQLLEARAVGS